MKVQLKQGASPIRCQPRNYSQRHRSFLNEFTRELVQAGCLFLNKESRWASPAYVVPKPGTNGMKLRVTVDLRKPNKMMEPLQWPMPHLETLLEFMQGCKYFITCDGFKGYWQLPLAKESQEIMSIMTHDGVYTPTRIPQGATDSVMHFQSAMDEIFADRKGIDVLAWIDDILGGAKTFEHWFEVVKYIVEQCEKFGLKLSATKTTLFATKVKWCGRIFSADGVQHDPERLKTLQNLREPQTIGELQEYIGAINWMRSSLLNFARIINELQKALNKALEGKVRTKRSTKNLPIVLDVKARESFEASKDMLQAATIRKHRDSSKRLLIFTDASKDGWAVVITQIPEAQIDFKEYVNMDHEPLTFLSGIFRGPSENWAIVEKEAFAIVMAMDKCEYLLYGEKPFIVYCDHRNLLYMFSESVRYTKTPKHTSEKLQRWAFRIQRFNYIIRHIKGEDNIWSDLLSRWGNGNNKKSNDQSIKSVYIPKTAIIDPLRDSTFEWPTITDIKNSQKKYKVNPKLTKKDQFIISNEDRMLIFRLLVISHCGSNGHHGVQSTILNIEKFLYWKEMKQDVQIFCKACLLCIQEKDGTISPRILGQNMHADEPNTLLHFDYLSMQESNMGYKYILVLKDDASQFVELIPCQNATANEAVRGILSWFARYGIVTKWVTDQGAHFKNELVRLVEDYIGAEHHFTPSYYPWINGTVERVMREILKVFKKLSQEINIDLKEWPMILPVIQMALNMHRSKNRANHNSIELFTGRVTTGMIGLVLKESEHDVIKVPWTEEEWSRNIEQLRCALREMHKKVNFERNKRNLSNKRYLSAKTEENIHKGDFVLWAYSNERKLHAPKLLCKWIGPFQVTQVLSTKMFEIEHLVTAKKYIVHSSRLRFYKDKSLQVNVQLKRFVVNQGTIMEVEQILNERFNKEFDRNEVLVKWRGFQDLEATWEPKDVIVQDVPAIYQKFKISMKKN